MDYKPRDIEKKWAAYWAEHQVYRTSNDSDKPKYYVLDMFPYPSGDGLHVGHPLGYIASDIFARYKRLSGFNVLHPMGYDAFGLPAEQYAIQTGVHPAVSTAKNVARYRSQLDNIGFSFDWSREVNTSDPAYYKWTQWIFLQLFNHYYDNDKGRACPIADLSAKLAEGGSAGVNAANSLDTPFSAEEWLAMSARQQSDALMNYRLAYRKETFVNWCEALGTVLANDEVKDGLSERGGHPVERRAMLQWSLRITAYAERLLDDMATLEWPDAMKRMQANWIGKSVGAQMFFDIEGHTAQLEIFTTRPDTIFGATFMVLAPEHDLVPMLTVPEQEVAIAEYVQYVKSRSERDRMADTKTVTGAFTGSYCLNPFTQERVPVWISEYVLKDYGTGAIMAVPSDDDRDHAFATKFGLPIIDVIDKSKYPGATRHDKLGIMINSHFLDGMEVPDAIEDTLQRIEAAGMGQRRVNYRLRDALYSRQRYWGEPFPITYDADGVAHALPLAELPLELPELDDFKPASNAKAPLARATEWVNLPNGHRRETDTMPGFAGSSWYFLRYMDPSNDTAFASPEALAYWRDVDLYVGGTEHAVGHLMYSRFWHKFLHDKGLVPTNEPFRKLINQGMIQGVIAYMYLEKEKAEGYPRFVCSGIKQRSGLGDEAYTRVPVHISLVVDYGTANTHMDLSSIEQFIAWRPEYSEAIFECGNGTYHRGAFKPKGEATGSQLYLHSEVGKMSKSKYNVINPDDVVEQYGADCFRMYEMFLGPVEQAKPWDTKGIDGVSRFLRKFWSLFYDAQGQLSVSDEAPDKAELKVLHQAIKKVTDDIERFSFNTCVSAFMVATNELMKLKCRKRTVLQDLVLLIAPFAPFVSEELWQQLGGQGSVHHANYPQAEAAYLVEDSISYPIAFNGKMRFTADFPADMDKAALEKEASVLPDVEKWLEGKAVKKIVVVPGRMINFVV